jgi:prolyl-tRNA synthetase
MAAIVEQHHDEQGIVWPDSVAPYDVHIVACRAWRSKRSRPRRRSTRRAGRCCSTTATSAPARSSPTPT